jgi:hypothetical protein
MDSPVILAVDEDPDALRNIDQELNDRFRYGSGKRVASAVGERAGAIQLLHGSFASEPQYPPDSSPERLAIIRL